VHAIATKGELIISGSSDKLIKVWSLESNKCVRTLRDHDNIVCKLVISRGALFSGSYAVIKIHDLQNFECLHTIRGQTHWVRAIYIDPESSLLYSGSHNTIRTLNLQSLTWSDRVIQGKFGSIYAVDVKNGLLFGGTYENAIYAWDLKTFEHKHTLRGHNGAVYCLCIHRNFLFSGSYDNTIRMWSLETFETVQLIRQHTSSVDALVSIPGKNLVFSASADNTIKMFELVPKTGPR